MADSIETILHDLGSRLARRGINEAFDAAERRIGDAPMGRAALGIAEALVEQYGDDAIDALLRAIHARQARRVERMVEAARARNDDAAERALERLREGRE